jgi:hypothetical protein
MIHIQIDGLKAVNDRLANMRDQIGKLKRADLPTEFREWQTDDLGREHSSGRFGRRRVVTIISAAFVVGGEGASPVGPQADPQRPLRWPLVNEADPAARAT